MSSTFLLWHTPSVRKELPFTLLILSWKKLGGFSRWFAPNININIIIDIIIDVDVDIDMDMDMDMDIDMDIDMWI